MAGKLSDTRERASDPISSLIESFGHLFEKAAEAGEAIDEAEDDSESLFELLQPLFAKGELEEILLIPEEVMRLISMDGEVHGGVREHSEVLLLPRN